MKKLALIVLVLSVSISSFAFTNNPVKTPENDKLRTEISNLLQSATIDFNSESLTALVTFTVTPKGELIVLGVESKNESIEIYLQSKLNYKKVSVKTDRQGVIYKLPLKIVKE